MFNSLSYFVFWNCKFTAFCDSVSTHFFSFTENQTHYFGIEMSAFYDYESFLMYCIELFMCIYVLTVFMFYVLSLNLCGIFFLYIKNY